MTGSEVSILFTSAGRRVELTQCFRRAAAELGLVARIHACDLKPEISAACQLADHSFAVPRCTNAGYIDTLLAYCSKHRVDLLIPTIDTELGVLASNAHRFEEIGTIVHVSPVEVIEIVRDKFRTMEVLERAGVPVPKTAWIEDARTAPGDWNWPVFVKPSGGSASRGISIASSVDGLRRDHDEPMIVQELLDGPEYTVNIYVDREGKLRSAIPHLRISTRAGEVEKGRTVRDPRLVEIAERLAAALPGARGVLCFQVIDDRKRGPLAFEINARFGGGYPLADHAGGQFAKSLLAHATGGEECASDSWRENVQMLRYDAAVFDG